MENYSGNNPDKHRAEIEHARAAVVALKRQCQAAGLLPMSDAERLSAELDRQHPDARSKTVVQYEGAFYWKRSFPAARSKSGKTVLAWETHWEKLAPDHEAVLAFLKPEPTEVEKACLAALRDAWPFPVPAGGLVLDLQEGFPAVAVSAKKVAVGYRNGYPELRTQLTAKVSATEEAIAALLNRTMCPSPSGKPAVYLGQTEDGRPAWLRKRGAGHQGLFIDTLD